MRNETISIYQVDAFTDQLFGGNPAAVCPLKEWLPDGMMQQIAAENNLAETAFFVRKEDDFELRWFTPEIEIDLCGHATLASAHIIFTELKYSGNTINFHTVKAGTLLVSREADRYTLDFPSRPAAAATIPEELISALGNQVPVEVYKSRDYVLVFDDENTIVNIQPDFAALAKINALCFVITAPGDHSDFVSRVFAPAAGNDEDPVTGSAHCALIPYWSKRLNKNELHAYQVSSRRGELWCSFSGERVYITGKAITYLKGQIFVKV